MPLRKAIPDEILIELRNRLELLAPRSKHRRREIEKTAELFGVSISTVYRSLRSLAKPHSAKRSDYGRPRVMPETTLERYCETIAALKVRTRNQKGRCLSTAQAIRLLEEFGVHTPKGFLQAEKGLLKEATINRYLNRWGYDSKALGVQQVARRFQAKTSNECWHFDLSQSDFKSFNEFEVPAWVEQREGRPLLMLYSVVDDRSGVAYQEYHVVLGEDVTAALRFLFRAMTPKETEGFPLQGRPQMLYMDNGPIARSQTFRRIMQMLGIEVRCHLPRGKGGRRVTARAKGKVERPFRTVKEVHETLYHFHKPHSEEEANSWLMNFLLRYNNQKHRSQAHSRFEDWVKSLPEEGVREMCSWERMRTFSREPESRTVGPDALISAGGVHYKVDDELAGCQVTVWWGLLDDELFVEHGDERYGPYQPDSGPIPLARFRTPRKTKSEHRVEKIEILAAKLELPREALTGKPESAALSGLGQNIPTVSFSDPDPFHQFSFPNAFAAKRAISADLGQPLAYLNEELRREIDALVSRTLEKHEVLKGARSIISISQLPSASQKEK